VSLYFTYELSASIISHKPTNNESNSTKTSKQRWTNGLMTANSDDAKKKKNLEDINKLENDNK
jgi:hypothetical protein